MSDSQTRKHVLVLGSPRSGTTLLTCMIGCHSEAAMLNEELSMASRDIVGKTITGNKLCIPNQIELNDLHHLTGRIGSKLPIVRHSLEFIDSKAGLGMLGPLRSQAAGEYSIEEHVARLSPLTLIGIVRDPNAVISSIMRRGEMSFNVACYRWRRAVEVLHHLSLEEEIDLHVISFKELVTAPEKTARRLANHLDLDFEERMLEAHRFTPNYRNRNRIESKRAKEKKKDFNIDELFPEVYRKYQSLVTMATSD